MSNPATKVFVSYSHDSSEHEKSVLSMTQELRLRGVDAVIDQFDPHPSMPWPRWMQHEIDKAAYVLMVVTEPYARRFAGRETRGTGLGATWEGAIITQELYDSSHASNKYIPVLMSGTDHGTIPQVLRGYTHIRWPSDQEKLLRLLTNQPAVTPAPLGSIPNLGRSDNATTKTSGKSLCIAADRTRIAWRLPRGCILLDHLEWSDNEGWSTIAEYYDESGEPAQGTHYHPSYRWFESNEHRVRQMRKLRTPIGDWPFAEQALRLMVSLRERSKEESIQSCLDPHETAISVFEPSAAITMPPAVPALEPFRRTSDIRDLIAEIRADHRWERPDDDTRIHMARLRQRAILVATRHLGVQHPSVAAVVQHVGRFETASSVVDLAEWADHLSIALMEIRDHLIAG